MLNVPPASRSLAGAANNAVLSMWNATAAARVWRLDTKQHRIRQVQFSPDGRLLAVMHPLDFPR